MRRMINDWGEVSEMIQVLNISVANETICS